MVKVPFFKEVLMQDGDKYKNDEYNDMERPIFLGYLILNSFLALFIGVFLQMMFDKKNIAEPL